MTVTNKIQTTHEVQAVQSKKLAPEERPKFQYFNIYTPSNPLKLWGKKMCFPPIERREGKRVGGGKGGVAPISPHVGNLSHINLAPNFHTCSSTCWKSSNSLTHTHTHTSHTYTHMQLSGTWPWVSLGAGGEPGHHRRGSVKSTGMLGIFAPHVASLCLS